MKLTLRRSRLDRIKALCASGIAFLSQSELAARDAAVPKPRVDIVDWMHANVYVPPDSSERPGPLRLTKLQQGIFRSFQEPGVEWVSFQKPPRFGASLGTVASCLYFAAHEGIDTFYAERADDYAQYVYKKFLNPMLTAEAGKLSHLKRPTGSGQVQDTWKDTILTTGASIQLRSASTDGAFRQLRAGFLVLDECSADAYRVGKEGDKTSLAWKRAQTARKPIMFLPSTPTVAGHCIVSREFKRSDQRNFFVPCPHCQVEQTLLPNVGKGEGAGLKYGVDEQGQLLTYVDEWGNESPDVWYECAACDEPIRETSKDWMIEHGEWRATRKPDQPGLVGFYAWAAYSTDPQSTWADIARQHVASLVDREMRQPFKNLVLALPWEAEEQRVVPVNLLQQRAEAYEAPCPQDVRLVTWGNDNQDGTLDGGKAARGEAVVLGWGANEECWVLGRFVGEHKPGSASWAKWLYGVADMVWRRPDGTAIKASAGGVDIGSDFDHLIQFCHLPESKKRRIRAVRGENTRLVKQTGEQTGKSAKNELFTFLRVYKQSATDTLMRRLRHEGAGAERIHFPKSLTLDFYEGLTAVTRVYDKAKNVAYWRKDADSEVYDCWVYAYAVMRSLVLNHSEVRGILFALRASSVDSPAPEATAPYSGDDRSANSALATATSDVRAPAQGGRLAAYRANKAKALPAPPKPRLGRTGRANAMLSGAKSVVTW